MGQRADTWEVRSRGRLSRGTLTAQLISIALVPTVALTFLAVGTVNDERTTAANATALADDIELERFVLAIYPFANVERIALGGLATIDQMGIDRTIVTALTGLDFEVIYPTSSVELDRRLTALIEQLRSTDMAGYGDMATTLGGVRADLEAAREASRARQLRRADGEALFERLDALLDELTSLAPSDALTRSSGEALIRALANVLASAGELAQAVVDDILIGSDDPASIAASTAVHDADISELDDLLDAVRRDDLAAIRTSYQPPPTVADADRLAFTTDPSIVARLTQDIVNQVEYLDDLEAFSANLHQSVIDAARAEAADAASRARRATIVAIVIVALTALLVVPLLIGTTRPLLRLSERARRIGQGEVDPTALPVRGPHAIRELTTAINDMSVTLHGVDAQISKMANGSVESNGVSLPGPLGVTIRQSVDRLRRVTDQLHESEELASAIVADAADAVWTVDDRGRITFANRSSERLTGLRPEAQVGRSLDDIIITDDGETFVRTTNGHDRAVLVTRSEIKAGRRSMWSVIAHDISERTQFETELALQARTDSLTDLPNRFAALEYLDHLFSSGQAFTLLFIDIDGFKSVNDTQGHAAGDDVLAQIGMRLSGATNPSEFVARLGGDEFVVVSADPAASPHPVELGRRLIGALEVPHEVNGATFALSASIGIVSSPATTSALDALRKADSALYAAKQRGRGRIEQYDAALQAALLRESDVDLALRQAVNNGEFVMHLQPVVSLQTGVIESTEALVRWNRPGLGLLHPSDFIPIAERSSNIIDIGRWVLRQACEQLAAWRRTDPTCSTSVAVNISGRHLIDGDLIDDLDRVLDATGADPGLLEFELTETHLLEDIDRATQVLNLARSRGIRVSVDDFGTGYSSMSYLRSLPIDMLKIDRSFIERSTDEGYDSTVVEAILTIARSIDLQVVAEGIETARQLDFARSRGCDRGQGYFLAPPMSPADAASVLFGAPLDLEQMLSRDDAGL